MFGELIESNSIGHSNVSPPQYIASNTIVYASANSLNFLSINQNITQTKQPPNSIKAKAFISTFATFPQEGIIAYACKTENIIRLIKYPSLQSVGINGGILIAPPDLEIVALTFSSDGQYLASLGSLPNHSLCVWDWRGIIPSNNSISKKVATEQNNSTQHAASSTNDDVENISLFNPLLCSTSNFGPATSISFNPLDKRMVCTSNPGSSNDLGTGNFRYGGNEYPNDEFDLQVQLGTSPGQECGYWSGIRFWKIHMGYKRWDILPITISQMEDHPILSKPATAVQPLLKPTHAMAISNPQKGYEEWENKDLFGGRQCVALGHVWRSDQSVAVTTTISDHMLIFSPGKGSVRAVQVLHDELKSVQTNNNESVEEKEAEDGQVVGVKEKPVTFHQCVIYAKDLLISGGENGALSLIKTDKANPQISKQIRISSFTPTGSNIISLQFAPNYTSFLIETEDGNIYISGVSLDPQIIVSNESRLITCIDSSKLSNTVITGSSNGTLLIWHTQQTNFPQPNTISPSTTLVGETSPPQWKKNLAVNKRYVFSEMFSCTSVAMGPLSSNFVAVGSKGGYLRLFELEFEEENPMDLSGGFVEEREKIDEEKAKLLFKQKVFNTPVEKVLFDPTGKYIVATSKTEKKVFIVGIQDGACKVLGYFEFIGNMRSCTFNYDGGFEEEEASHALFLYVLASDDSNSASYIHRYLLPNATTNVECEPNSLLISKTSVPNLTYRIETILIDIALQPAHFSAGRETFYVLSEDKKLMTFAGPPQIPQTAASSSQAKPDSSIEKSSGNNEKKDTVGSSSVEKSDFILISKPTMEIIQHEKSQNKLKLGNCIDWISTFSQDGKFSLKSLLEPDKEVRVLAHDPFQNGVKDLAMLATCNGVVSLGNDGVLKFWEWCYSPGGWKSKMECQDDWSRGVQNKSAGITEGVDDSMDLNDEVSLSFDSLSTDCAHEVDSEKIAYQEQLLLKISEIRKVVRKVIQKNDIAPALEKIDKEEFVLDFQERDRLLSDADSKIKAVRKQIEAANCKKIIVQQRIKTECWDSMEIVGQSVKSFNNDSLTGRIIEATNYPLRKCTEEELSTIKKIKLLRKVAIEVSKAANPKHNRLKDTNFSMDEDNQSPESTLAQEAIPASPEKVPSGAAALLYNPFELITNERRRVQAILYREYISDLKKELNGKFILFVEMKKTGISKIEEKNERIKSIMEELQIEETILHPELDDDEVPERIIHVLDEEYITPEERRKIEEKRVQDEERARQQKQDNWAERALQMMMGGKLEDRSDQEEKIELVRPDWMIKPKEEMNEEEKKLVKEFDKKLAVFKEEQEKYKKALETELRKLQSSIGEVCDTFDNSLQEFFNSKLETDQLIFQAELKLIKLNQTSVFSEDDEAKEEEILDRLNHLKEEKINFVAEIPEIKKDLERCREEYDHVVKRDKDIERQFKKEFHSFDFYFDALMKLFKRRDTSSNLEFNNSESRTIKNPFQTPSDKATVWEEPVPLNIDTDLPEGLSSELWLKLVELRDKKISLEQEAFISFNRFQEMQTLVQAVLDESERIKNEMDKLTMDYNQFLEYKFHTTYNVESLLQLKQGQVEIPQAPVVTDYSDAVLIHRNQVERLNESIVTLGKSKVDALKEMKDYRKGIHALEWENKKLDFQAEDAILRTRDIQLLRLTKQMQEYLRSGDEHAQASELSALEKRAEYSQKAHSHVLEEKKRAVSKLKQKIHAKSSQNSLLDTDLGDLEKTVSSRSEIHDSSAKNTKLSKAAFGQHALADIYTRRKLVDLAKGQAQDIAILREEVERLRLRTYPAFSSSKRTGGF